MVTLHFNMQDGTKSQSTGVYWFPSTLLYVEQVGTAASSQSLSIEVS
jgi:hypothetical protein